MLVCVCVCVVGGKFGWENVEVEVVCVGGCMWSMWLCYVVVIACRRAQRR